MNPRRDVVAGAVGDRVGAEGVAGEIPIQRILDPLASPVANDLKLVLHAGSGRDLEREVPDVRGLHSGELLGGLQAKNPVFEVDGVGRAAPNKRDRGTADDGERVRGEESVDLLRRAWTALKLKDGGRGHG